MVDDHSQQGFNLQPQEIDRLQQESGEKNLRGRTGGAVTLAVGIAKIFDGIPGLSGLMKYWYHFAIMFEALFIMTTIDTGTRVARFLVGEFGGRFYRRLEEPNWLPAQFSPVPPSSQPGAHLSGVDRSQRSGPCSELRINCWRPSPCASPLP
jgi:carbon starvation protein CstA